MKYTGSFTHSQLSSKDFGLSVKQDKQFGLRDVSDTNQAMTLLIKNQQVMMKEISFSWSLYLPCVPEFSLRVCISFCCPAQLLSLELNLKQLNRQFWGMEYALLAFEITTP